MKLKTLSDFYMLNTCKSHANISKKVRKKKTIATKNTLKKFIMSTLTTSLTIYFNLLLLYISYYLSGPACFNSSEPT